MPENEQAAFFYSSKAHKVSYVPGEKSNNRNIKSSHYFDLYIMYKQY